MGSPAKTRQHGDHPQPVKLQKGEAGFPLFLPQNKVNSPLGLICVTKRWLQQKQLKSQSINGITGRENAVLHDVYYV